MHVSRFAALGDPVRFRLVEMLSVQSLPVHTLTAAFSISRPAISRHLRVLKEAGVVTEEKSGRENLYKLQPQHLVPLSAWLAGIEAPVGQVASVAAKAPSVKAVVSPKPRKAKVIGKAQPVAKPQPEIVAKPQPEVVVKPPKVKAEKPAPKPAPAQNQMAWEF